MRKERGCLKRTASFLFVYVLLFLLVANETVILEFALH
jgi:hypothetical protein